MDPKISAIAGLVLAQTEWKWERCLQFAYDVQTINNGLDAASQDPAKRAIVRRNENEEAISEDVRFVENHTGTGNSGAIPAEPEPAGNAS